MPEVEHTPLAAGCKSRTEYGVRAAIHERAQELAVLIGIVFEIGILDDAQFAARLANRTANGRSFALIGSGFEQANRARVFLGDSFYLGHGRIGRAIIHDDDLPVEAVWQRRSDHSLQQGGDKFLLVIQRYQNRDFHPPVVVAATLSTLPQPGGVRVWSPPK